MEMSATKYKVHKCSKCQGDIHYSCIFCACDMCSQCKENHEQDLNTIDHNVVLYRYKPKSSLKQGNHSKHASWKKQYAFCLCTEHRKHTLLYNRVETGHQQRMIQIIRKEVLFNRQVLMTTIKKDHKTCHSIFTVYQSEMLNVAQKLKKTLPETFCGFDFKHRCLKQRRKLNKDLSIAQIYEHIYEQSAVNPVQFLRIKYRLLQLRDSPILTLHTSHISIDDAINKSDVMDLLFAIRMSDGKKRRVQNKHLLKLMSAAELYMSLTINNVSHCDHISCVTSDRAWISCRDDCGDKLVLINTDIGCPIDTFNLKNKSSEYCDGLHTINKEGELVFIMGDCITKRSKNTKTTTKLIEPNDSSWRPRCVYCSPSTGDLLVGMYRYSKEIETGKVARYNQTGQLIKTVFTDSTGNTLYKSPHYITENNNGDIVVSDKEIGVVVTEVGGRHRFNYTGHPTDSGLSPRGICTDALSHILVCDGKTNTVQMLDRDGHFLSYLLKEPIGIFDQKSLGYDANTHRLYVGSQLKSDICVYRFITRHVP